MKASERQLTLTSPMCDDPNCAQCQAGAILALARKFDDGLTERDPGLSRDESVAQLVLYAGIYQYVCTGKDLSHLLGVIGMIYDTSLQQVADAQMSVLFDMAQAQLSGRH